MNNAPTRVNAVEAIPATLSLNVEWSNGSTSLVDMSGLVRNSQHFKVFTTDAATFCKVRPVHYGTGIGWENGLDYSAASLKALADQQASA